MVNRSNSPGCSPPAVAVQVIVLTASVTSPSSVCTGLASVVVSAAAVHPYIGWVLTDAMGFLVGNNTSNFTVLAVSSSLGTLKLNTASPPFGALEGVMLTCAAA